MQGSAIMNFSRILSVVLRQYYLLRGSPARVLPLITWVGVDMLLWGFITRYLSSITSAKYNFVATLLGAVLLWNFFTRIMHGITQAFFEEVWSRNFLNLFASPMSVAEYLTGLVVTSMGTSLIGLIIMLALAGGFFGLSLLVYGVMIVPFFLVLVMFGIALGIVGVTIVLRFGPGSEWFVWPIPALLTPFVGTIYPISTLPPWIQHVSRLLPPSYVFEGMRAIVGGDGFSPAILLGAVALCGLYILLAGWLFLYVFRQAVRTGLIARYSAESVS
jgi:ABC-2 type transport system permease protein